MIIEDVVKALGVNDIKIIDPNEAVVMGGTWRIPVMEKLLKKSFIEELEAKLMSSLDEKESELLKSLLLKVLNNF